MSGNRSRGSSAAGPLLHAFSEERGSDGKNHGDYTMEHRLDEATKRVIRAAGDWRVSCERLHVPMLVVLVSIPSSHHVHRQDNELLWVGQDCRV